MLCHKTDRNNTNLFPSLFLLWKSEYVIYYWHLQLHRLNFLGKQYFSLI